MLKNFIELIMKFTYFKECKESITFYVISNFQCHYFLENSKNVFKNVLNQHKYNISYIFKNYRHKCCKLDLKKKVLSWTHLHSHLSVIQEK